MLSSFSPIPKLPLPSSLALLFASLLSLTLGSLAEQVSPDHHLNATNVHPLSKRDPSFVPAEMANQNCALISLKYAPSKSNKGIQMSECHVNSRIDSQLFAVFVPDDGNMLQPREYGPYGTCYAFSQWPLSTNLQQAPNANYACFGWTKKSGSKGTNPIPKLPGTPMKPPPLGCPSNLNPCYADHVYSPGGKLAAFANEISTFSGLMFGAKDANQNWLWCYGCKVGTNFQMQRENIGKLGCDTSKCAKYTGVTTLLNTADQSPLSQSAVQNTTAGQGNKGGVGGTGGSQTQNGLQTGNQGGKGTTGGTGGGVDGGAAGGTAGGGTGGTGGVGGTSGNPSTPGLKQTQTQSDVNSGQNGGGASNNGLGQSLSGLFGRKEGAILRSHRRAKRRLTHV